MNDNDSSRTTPAEVAPSRCRWKMAVIGLLLIGGWCAFMMWRTSRQPSLTLPDGTKIAFHSLTIGAPKNISITPGKTIGHHAHPSLVPPVGWWHRTRTSIIAALPTKVKSLLPASWWPDVLYLPVDSFELMGYRHTASKYRFAFEVSGTDFKSTDWSPSITSEPNGRDCHLASWSSGGWGGFLAIGSGSTGGGAPPPPPRQTFWFTIYSDSIPEDASSFRLEMRRKPTSGSVDKSDPAHGFSFKNPLGGAKSR